MYIVTDDEIKQLVHISLRDLETRQIFELFKRYSYDGKENFDDLSNWYNSQDEVFQKDIREESDFDTRFDISDIRGFSSCVTLDDWFPFNILCYEDTKRAFLSNFHYGVTRVPLKCLDDVDVYRIPFKAIFRMVHWQNDPFKQGYLGGIYALRRFIDFNKMNLLITFDK